MNDTTPTAVAIGRNSNGETVYRRPNGDRYYHAAHNATVNLDIADLTNGNTIYVFQRWFTTDELDTSDPRGWRFHGLTTPKENK